MPSLADVQSRIRDRVVLGGDDDARWLVGGSAPGRRLALHRRHYQASLIANLHDRFPATAWLLGDEAVITAAAAFVVDHPPRVFCMAEYGADFPDYLGCRSEQANRPYVAAFAALEWAVGAVSVAVSNAPLPVTWLTEQDPVTVGRTRLTLQPGVVHLQTDWAVDGLMQTYLSGSAPEQFTLSEESRWLEVRGSRGDVQLNALAESAWRFRTALHEGFSIEDAASAALDVDAAFDPGAALIHLFTTQLITSTCP